MGGIKKPLKVRVNPSGILAGRLDSKGSSCSTVSQASNPALGRATPERKHVKSWDLHPRGEVLGTGGSKPLRFLEPVRPGNRHPE